MLVRDASEPGDAAACAAIYAPYVLDTAITFELDPPSAAEMAARIEIARTTHAWLVAEAGSRVVGYAYGGEYKSRAAYRYSCEVSVYVARGSHRGGVGRALYTELLQRLADRGFRVAVAGMTLPNDASAALHTKLGFEPVGTYRQIGWKNDSWHDVAWTQRSLGSAAKH
ncbi:GNAT family N-acetyltransferase [Actinophytocola algeriensis]|uniref:Phosphinothricin acetyltransferase n=1 Tax=Actinophytocola algeriensis TaxID=1768010 RepID=A0A7W7QB68_9PSEU|nr:GNAT family N-acetyltransferase [Actinophytocola algeriensis]MBB4910357.1 phosphinothricin acetyltransferase [Actinophytocola algeriensis]MBE1480654.1 phosphinothricin acetyltransferase [Actinophytocola algeriensis]